MCENRTVFVHNGTYQAPKQSIIIDKPLNLEGENKTNTIIKGFITSDCIIVTTWYVNISGFNLTAGGPSSWLAAIKIIIPESNKTTVNIFDNIMFCNHNGIYVTLDGMQNGNTSVNIYENEIFNNVNDGVILVSDNNIVRDNDIHDNGDGGIDIWSSDYNTIEFNIIYNNSHQGIWHDDGQRNKIGYNTIENNDMNGIVFFTEKKEAFRSYSTYNKIYNNAIKSNGGGILLYHSNDNRFYNNTIELNIDYGLKIQHISLSRNYKDDIKNRLITSNFNEIYHNNFIDNGKNGKCNAVDSLRKTNNDWDGNYWRDHNQGQGYDDRNGTWMSQYRIPFSFFGRCLDFSSYNYDETPWCRKNGWGPREPYQPDKPHGDSFVQINEAKTYTSCTTDPNGDKIMYGWNWTGRVDDRNLTVDDWDGKYTASGKIVEKEHKWDRNGTFEVRVIAKDLCEDGKTDGCSEWSEPLNVIVKIR